MKLNQFFVDLPIRAKMFDSNEILDYHNFDNKEELKRMDPDELNDFLKRKDLEVINGLNKNGPIRKLTPKDINTRSIVILGVEPTSKMSIHPEGDCNGKDIRILSQISKQYPGAPMMVGHQTDTTPWGRTFRASIISGMKGYLGPIIKNDYWFLNDEEGNGIARKIDAGIWAEGSIQYYFKEARCSICHKPMASTWFGRRTRCGHTIGKKDQETGSVCYWYPNQIVQVVETSYVFRGSYGKTKSMMHSEKSLLSESYSDLQIEAGIELEKQLLDNGLTFESEAENESSSNSESDQAGREHIDADAGKPENSSNSNNEEAAENSEPEGSAGTDGNEDTGSNGSEGSSEENSEGNSDSSSEENSGSSEGTEENSDSGSESGTDGGETGGTEGDESGSNESDQNGESGETSGSEGNDEGSSESNQDESSGSTGRDSGDSSVNSEEENSENNESEDNSDGEKKSIDPPQVTENGENSENTPEGSKEENSEEKPEDNTDGGTSKSNDLNTDGEDDDEDDSSENDSDEKLSVIINEILNDDDLTRDEKEDSIREEMAGYSSEKIEEALSRIDNSSDNSVLDNSTLSCLLCGNAYKDLQVEYDEESKENHCKYCGGKVEKLNDVQVEFFSHIPFVGPKKTGSINNEFFNKEEFSELSDGEYCIEPLYDGVFMSAHKKDGEVKILGDSSDYTENFPGIVEELKSIESDNFVILGQMTRWRGRKRLKHEDVISYLSKEESEYNDASFKFKPFDMLIVDSKNISSESFIDRRKKLDETIKFGKQIHPTAYKVVSHKKDENKIVDVIDDRKTREGVLIRNSSMIYSKSDSSKLWYWNLLHEVNCKVIEIEKEENDQYVYTCEVGNGKNSFVIGKTFTTKLEAKVGDVITVSVDHINFDDEKYLWFAPKVISLRNDKNIDPISVVENLSKLESFDSGQNFASLSEVIPLLKKIELKNDIYLTGDIVTNGVSTNSIGIISKVEMDESEKEKIIIALGESLGRMANIVYDENGPDGPNIIVESNFIENKFEHSDKFVIQKHGWGNKEHYDLRFGSHEKEMLFGWICFSSLSNTPGSSKIRCQEKKDHDSLWMDIDSKSIKPSQPGNPTTDQNAWMVKEDSGKYECVKHTENFLEVILHGDKYDGRFLLRKINIGRSAEVYGDEVSLKNNSVWIICKPKEQEKNSPVKKLAYKYHNNCLTYWETNEVDTDI